MGWSVYLIVSGSRTYVGSTTNVERRLRQHNGEIRGGARATRGRKWRLVCYVTGFENRSAACRWEKLVKGRARGLSNRTSALQGLVECRCPMNLGREGQKYYEVPKGLEIVYE